MKGGRRRALLARERERPARQPRRIARIEACASGFWLFDAGTEQGSFVIGRTGLARSSNRARSQSISSLAFLTCIKTYQQCSSCYMFAASSLSPCRTENAAHSRSFSIHHPRFPYTPWKRADEQASSHARPNRFSARDIKSPNAANRGSASLFIQRLGQGN